MGGQQKELAGTSREDPSLDVYPLPWQNTQDGTGRDWTPPPSPGYRGGTHCNGDLSPWACRCFLRELCTGPAFWGGGGVVSPASPLASSPFPDCLLLRGIAWALLPCRAVPPPAPATLYFFSSLSPFSSQAAAASASLRASYRLPGLGKPARGGHLVQRAPAATLGPPASVALQRSDCLKFESCLRHELRGWSWASH